MLELLNQLEKCNDEEFKNIKSNIDKYSEVLNFVKEMFMDKNHLMNTNSFINMMVYFRYEKNKNVRVKNVGKYVMEKCILLKKRELQNKVGNMKLEISSFNYLRQIIKKLRENIKQVNQYNILKNAFIFMTYSDIYWFVNLLTKNYLIDQKIYDLIKYKKLME